jgi:tetratricopeptide (TPR) repeat protein
MSTKRFRVAFSFAGEKRDYVAEIAALLAQRFGEEAILYDKYHEAEFSRDDLAFYLPKLYHEDSDLIVAVFSSDYEKKEWCGLEYKAIFDLIKRGLSREVMLTRFGHVQGQGLFSLAGYSELDSRTPGQASHLILERLAVNEGRPKNYYMPLSSANGPSPKSEIPHNLPTLQPFFGRDGELKKIAEALLPENRGWGVLIDGPGGIGKTSLALRAAYAASPEDFRIIVFVSLKTRELDDDGERDLSGFILPGLIELFTELARRMGIDDIAKIPEDQRPGLLLDTLTGRQALLVFDNLESLVKKDRDRLFNFVKRLPQGCKAIVTSRGRIGSGAEEIILQELSQQPALDILAELAQRNALLAKTTEPERVSLYFQTGGNPLLLRWTAGQLGRGHCLTLGDALDFLRSCPNENDPLEFIFGDLAKQFTSAETKVLSALTYFFLPTTVQHVAIIAGLPEGGAGLALRSLANRSLVTPDGELKAFTLVPLVSDFLRKHNPAVVAETGTRLEKHAYALIIENGYSNYARFPTLDVAWPSISPALPLFVAGRNDRLSTVCTALATFLNFTGRWDELLALNEQAERKAVEAGDYRNAGWEAYHAGCAYHLRRQSDKVLACADRAAMHWHSAKAGIREQATATHLRGLGHHLRSDHTASMTAYREALELWQSLFSESEDVTIALDELASAEAAAGEFVAAERDFQEALRIARKHSYYDQMAVTTANLAVLARALQDWPRTENLAREALVLSEKVKRQDSIAGSCLSLAEALLRQGKASEGLPYARRATELYARLKSPWLEGARATQKNCEESAFGQSKQ